MSAVILSGVAVAILFVLLGFKKGKSSSGVPQWSICKKQWFSLFGLLLILTGSVASVPTGHTGILTTFGKVEDTTLEAGVHFKAPYQEVVIMDNRAQKASIDMMCFSSDIQEVNIKYSINYQINKENAQNIYKTIGADYYTVIMEPRIQEAVKSVTAGYTADTLIEKRSELSTQILEILKENLQEYNIIVLNTAIENMDFSDAFTDAVEAKQVAEQDKLKAAIEQEQKNIEAKESANRQIIEADAAAEVKKKQADADYYAGEKEAQKNAELSKSLTDEVIRYYYSGKWNGELPNIVGSEAVLPVLGDVGTPSTPEASESGD